MLSHPRMLLCALPLYEGLKSNSVESLISREVVDLSASSSDLITHLEITIRDLPRSKELTFIHKDDS